METSLLEKHQAEVEQKCSLVGNSCYYSVIGSFGHMGIRVVFKRISGTSWMSDPMWSAVSGVCSAGLMTTVFPQLRAGAIFHMNISNGKFH